AHWLQVEQEKRIIPVHPKAEEVFGEPGYASLADIPDQDIKVVDCFVRSELVGDIVDQAIEHRDRLGIDAVWMQLGVIDEAAADRAREAGLGVVMDSCPKIEARRLGSLGAARCAPPPFYFPAPGGALGRRSPKAAARSPYVPPRGG